MVRINPPFRFVASSILILLTVLGWFVFRGIPDNARRHPHRELSRRYVLVHHAPGPEIGILADGDRRYEVCVDPGENAVFYSGAVLGFAVIVRCDRTRAQVHPFTDLCIPDVVEVWHLAPRPDPRVLDL